MPSLLTGLLLAVALSVYPLLGLYSRLVVLGAFRSPALPVSHFASKTFVIPEIQQAEDFAYHQPSGLIFFLGQGDPSSRLSWYPALNILDNPAKAATADGQIWALDPKNWKPKRVPITNWNAPFVTHGIDIHIPSNDPNTFYLHAVNHRPPADGVPGPTDSVVEVFKVDLSAFSATHLKTVSHSTIHTPNDILSLGPHEFLVTNDHANVDGLLRSAEEILTLQLASRTTLIHVNAATDVEAKVVKTGIHSANGLGRDASGNIVLMSAASGRLAILDDQYAIKTSTFFDTTLDNPTYYADPAATTTSDASAHVLAGIMTAVDIRDHARDPKFNFRSVIWLARERNGVWEKKKLLEDDGEWLNFATTAMLLPIGDTGSKKEAWVVATGVLARGVSVGRVDLTEWASGHGLPKNKA